MKDFLEKESLASRKKWGTFSSFRYSNYRLLWFGNTISHIGDFLQMVALHWLVYEITRSPFLLGVRSFARAFPRLSLGLISGVLADRVERHKLMVVCQTIDMLLAFTLAYLAYLGIIKFWHILLITAAHGTVDTINSTARQALVPELVAKEDLMNAIALYSISLNGTRIIGPALGGLVVGLLGVAGCFFINGLSFLAIIISLLLMHIPPKMIEEVKGNIWENIEEGFKYLNQNREVFALILVALIPVIFGMPYNVLMPVFAQDILKVGPSGFGLLMSVPGIGALLVGITLASLRDCKRKGILLLGGTFFFGVMLVFFSFSHWFLLSLLFLVGVGAMNMLFRTTANTLIQLLVVDEFRGRVTSIYLLDKGFMPLGGLMLGTLASLAGAPFALGFGGAICALLALGVIFKVPSLRRL